MKYNLSLVFTVLCFGCSSGDNTTIGNPLVSLNIAPFVAPQAFNKVSPFAVNTLQLCVKRLRFKAEDEDTNLITGEDEDNIDISLGLVNVDPSGTFNGMIILSSNTSINLNVFSMIQALDSVTSADQIKDVLEDINNEGDFDEDN